MLIHLLLAAVLAGDCPDSSQAISSAEFQISDLQLAEVDTLVGDAMDGFGCSSGAADPELIARRGRP